MKKIFYFPARLKDSKGVTAVVVAIFLVIIVGFAALAVDVGYMLVTRNELQNATDAAALAGCYRLYARPPAIGDPPNWQAAIDEINGASGAITMNTADNKPLDHSTVMTGWWDITQPSLGLQPPTPLPPGENYGPAVNVTIAKTAGQNNGPIATFFGRIFGVITTNSSATATAVASSRGEVRSGAIIPVAISKEVANLWEDHRTTAEAFIIGSDYHYPTSNAGQWTSFRKFTNSASYLKDLIKSGNSETLSIGDDIWIQTGTERSLYYDSGSNAEGIHNQYAGMDVFLPVVDALITGKDSSIRSFIGYHLICADKGCVGKTVTYNGSSITFKNNNCQNVIVGYFTTEPYNSEKWPTYGLIDRCRLCK